MKLGLWLYFLIPVHLVVAFAIERFAAKRAKATRLRAEQPTGTSSPTEDEHRKFQSTWKTAWMAHAANVTIALGYTTYIVYYKIHHPLIGTLTIAHAIVVWLKAASYAFTNRDLRHAFLYPSKGAVDALPEIYNTCPYPQNITLGNLVYFWWAPTLVYQPVYPRSDRIRWLFVIKRVGEVVGLTVFMWFCSAQWAAPVLRNSFDKMASLDLFAILERLLKLSTISLVVWLAGFFALFQSFLNALAEITQFGDRDFYEPWWNSESLGTYWRTWNKPVYGFFRRHIYSPMRARGFSHKTASAVVFLISAILHEILVGAPTHNLIGEEPPPPPCPPLPGARDGPAWLRNAGLTWAEPRRRHCVRRHAGTASPDHHDGFHHQERVSRVEGLRQRGLLAYLYHIWAAIRGAVLFLRLAGQVRKRWEDDRPAAAKPGRGDTACCCLDLIRVCQVIRDQRISLPFL